MSILFFVISGFLFAFAGLGVITGIKKGGEPDAVIMVFIASGVFAIAGVLS